MRTCGADEDGAFSTGLAASTSFSAPPCLEAQFPMPCDAVSGSRTRVAAMTPNVLNVYKWVRSWLLFQKLLYCRLLLVEAHFRPEIRKVIQWIEVAERLLV